MKQESMAAAVAVLGYTPKPGILDSRVLDQDTYWVPSHGRPLLIREMTPEYADNVRKYLARHADDLIHAKDEYFDHSGWEPGPFPAEIVRGSKLYVALKDWAGRLDG